MNKNFLLIFFISLFFLSPFFAEAVTRNPIWIMDGYWFLDDDASALNAEDNTGYGTGNTAQETAIIGVERTTPFRIRVDISENNNQTTSGTVAARLEYKLGDVSCTDTSWTQVTTTGTVNAFQIVGSTNITDQDTVGVDRISGNTRSFGSGGYLIDASNQAPAITFANVSREWEFNIQATSNATEGQIYTFRVSNAGTALTTYTMPSSNDCPNVTIAVPNTAPTLTVDEPDGTSDSVAAGDLYNIQYDLADTTDVVTAAFYYDTDSSGLNGTSISGDCASAAEGTNATCSWNTSGVTPGTYYIYGVTSDGKASSVSDYSPGQITITPGPAVATLEQSKAFSHTYLSPTTSISATLDQAATAGNLIVTAVAIDKSSGTITTPTGFTLLHSHDTLATSGAIAYKIATGGETTVSWSYANSEEASVWVGEYSGTATSDVVDVTSVNDTNDVAATSVSTGTTGATSNAEELAMAILIADSGNSMETGRAWTNGFNIIAHVTDTSGSPAINIATKNLSSVGTQETTFSTTGIGDEMYAMLITFKLSGGGSATVTQAGYKWFSNTNSTAVGNAASLNTPMIAPAQGVPFRLRMLLHAAGAAIEQNGLTATLQYAERSGTCDPAFSGESWSNVSSTTGAIRFYDNSGAADGATLTSHRQDPKHAASGLGSDTVNPQVYSEGSANFINSVSGIPDGEDGLWDFALIDSSAKPGTTYCFRAINSDTSTFDSYSVVPEITTASNNKLRLKTNVRVRNIRLK